MEMTVSFLPPVTENNSVEKVYVQVFRSVRDVRCIIVMMNVISMNQQNVIKLNLHHMSAMLAIIVTCARKLDITIMHVMQRQW